MPEKVPSAALVAGDRLGAAKLRTRRAAEAVVEPDRAVVLLAIPLPDLLVDLLGLLPNLLTADIVLERVDFGFGRRGVRLAKALVPPEGGERLLVNAETDEFQHGGPEVVADLDVVVDNGATEAVEQRRALVGRLGGEVLDRSVVRDKRWNVVRRVDVEHLLSWRPVLAQLGVRAQADQVSLRFSVSRDAERGGRKWSYVRVVVLKDYIASRQVEARLDDLEDLRPAWRWRRGEDEKADDVVVCNLEGNLGTLHDR